MLVRFCETSKKMIWVRQSEYGDQAINLAETTCTFLFYCFHPVFRFGSYLSFFLTELL